MRLRSLLPSPALAVGFLALVISLGGVAYAVKPAGNAAGPQEVVAYANVLEDGTPDAALSSNNLPASSITNPSAGVYCFKDVGFTINSAVVTGDNSNANDDTIASVALDNTGGPLSGCPAGSNARVRTLDANGTEGSNTGSYAPARVDHRFVIWLRGSKE